MSPAFDCEALFNRVEELAGGMAALGDMLQWAPPEVKQSTLVAVGGMITGMGKDIVALRTQYLDKSFHEIRALEISAAEADKQNAKSNVVDFNSSEGKARIQALAVEFFASQASVAQVG